MEKKRINYTTGEKLSLTEIISGNDYLNTIESKKYDHYSIQNKGRAWEEISQKFNCSSNCKRDGKQLMILWRDLKIKAIKDYAYY